MNFDNMTPQEAAEMLMDEIERDDPIGSIASASARLRIAEACQHFYERGKRDAERSARRHPDDV